MNRNKIVSNTKDAATLVVFTYVTVIAAKGLRDFAKEANYELVRWLHKEKA